AVAVSAHEVGHALQDHTGYRPLVLRTRLARLSFVAEKIASMILVSFPFLIILTKSHWMGILIFLAGITIMLLPVIMHMITLPVEWDASFGRALPILQAGQYLPEAATPIIRKILTAAALTYVAGSLASLLNFYRWIAILRR
ncbi:MAG: zinc metallopeptidase, partial [Thiotrichales bacterium]|nr:zinc metallopeptidase [Thiotrichales bacterium]